MSRSHFISTCFFNISFFFVFNQYASHKEAHFACFHTTTSLWNAIFHIKASHFPSAQTTGTVHRQDSLPDSLSLYKGSTVSDCKSRNNTIPFVVGRGFSITVIFNFILSSKQAPLYVLPKPFSVPEDIAENRKKKMFKILQLIDREKVCKTCIFRISKSSEVCHTLLTFFVSKHEFSSVSL